MGLPHDSLSQRTGRRNVSAQCARVPRRGQQLGRADPRREARIAFRADRIDRFRLLWRKSCRRQFVRQLFDRAGCRNRPQGLALSGDSARHVGPRPAGAAVAGHSAARGPRDRRGGANHKKRACVCIRARDRPAARADRRSESAAGGSRRRSPREIRAAAAIATAIHAAENRRSRPHRSHARGPPGGAGAIPDVEEGLAVHAAEPGRNAHHAGLRRRRRMGWLDLGSRDPAVIRECE